MIKCRRGSGGGGNAPGYAPKDKGSGWALSKQGLVTATLVLAAVVLVVVATNARAFGSRLERQLPGSSAPRRMRGGGAAAAAAAAATQQGRLERLELEVDESGDAALLTAGGGDVEEALRGEGGGGGGGEIEAEEAGLHLGGSSDTPRQEEGEGEEDGEEGEEQAGRRRTGGGGGDSPRDAAGDGGRGEQAAAEGQQQQQQPPEQQQLEQPEQQGGEEQQQGGEEQQQQQAAGEEEQRLAAQQQGGDPLLQPAAAAGEQEEWEHEEEEEEEEWEHEEEQQLAAEQPGAEQQQQQHAVAAGQQPRPDEAAAGPQGGQGQGQGGGGGAEEVDEPSPYQQAVARCHDVPCLTAAAQLQRSPGQFLFPHFFVIGWQKCATTSLFFHLRDKHPQVMATHSKEPEFFSDTCKFQPARKCPLPSQEWYLWHTLRLPQILEAGMRTAGAEASTHYGRNGQLLARNIRKAFPWLKIIASMREPISRAISMLAHNLDKANKGCLAKRLIYPCLVKELGRTNYSEPFQAWLDEFPLQQVLLVQYENLTSQQHGREVLRRVKTFLDLDPALPVGEDFIGHNNSRAQRMQQMGKQPEGWPMQREQYKDLVHRVRPDAERIAAIVDLYGFGDGAAWLANWEAEWQATLDDCGPQGECEVFPN